ncbi:hypothetical protein [Candidatus Nitrosopumilus sediminis]|nr:hypothetical protein [Candidatus Nitrosopumilus sediminis]
MIFRRIIFHVRKKSHYVCANQAKVSIPSSGPRKMKRGKILQKHIENLWSEWAYPEEEPEE